ncbi:MAG: hypothetical protein M1833_007359 [Piccolia ochrophora]|nr:MAG: hypothetical protein M1833_007359 [Piccolia ochrophora]
MGKTPNLKKQSQSAHSRAARRAVSPSINTDKSLKTAKPPEESLDYRPSVLAIHQGAGVTKKTKRGRALSTKQRKRQQKGLERAELVIDRTEKKILKSVGRGKTTKARRAAWDELNEKLVDGTSKPRLGKLQSGTENGLQERREENSAAHDSSEDGGVDATDVALPDEGEIL